MDSNDTKEKDQAPPDDMKFVKALYRKKMNKYTATPNFIETENLLERHEHSIQYTLDILADAAPLTSTKKRQVKQTLETLFSHYREINLKKRTTPGPAIGIDLGTTNCCVAVYESESGQVRIIHNDMGFDKTPSVVAFPTDQEEPIFGETAKMLAYQNPQNTIYSVKRMLGRQFDRVKLQNQMVFWPFTILNDNNDIKIRIYGPDKSPRTTYSPEEISSLLIKHLKETAEDALGAPVLNAVVAVPAYFNAHQRDLTKQACTAAGLNVLQLINEPTAAALAYNIHKSQVGEGDDVNNNNSGQGLRNCLIFDLGGGTFDVAVLSIKNNQVFIKTIGGDSNLGGEDFDNNMVNHCVEEFKRKHGVDLTAGKNSDDSLIKFKSSKGLRRLKMECEKQKICLGKVKRATVSVEAIHDLLDLTVEFTSAMLDELNLPLYKKCISIVEDVLRQSGVKKEEIHDIVLAGGSTRIPKIQQMLSDFFEGAQLNREINPDDAIATGAAMLAFYAENPEVPNVLIREPQFVKDDISEGEGDGDDDDGFVVDHPKTEEVKRPSVIAVDHQNLMNFDRKASFSGREASPSPSVATTPHTEIAHRPAPVSVSVPVPSITINEDPLADKSVPLYFSNAAFSETASASKKQPKAYEPAKVESIQKKRQIMDDLSVTVILRADVSLQEEMPVKSQIHGFLEKRNSQFGSKFQTFYVALHDKLLYFFPTEEDFWANEQDTTTISIHQCSCEIRDYLGSKRSFMLKDEDGIEFLFLAENEKLVKDWVRHLERNAAVRLDNKSIPKKLSNIEEKPSNSDEEIPKFSGSANEQPKDTVPEPQKPPQQDVKPKPTVSFDLPETDVPVLDEDQVKDLHARSQIHGQLDKKNFKLQSKVIRLSKFQSFYAALHDKYLYLFQTKEEFIANAQSAIKIYIHKSTCEIKDYLGSKRSFMLKVSDGSEYLFLAEDASLVEDWVRHIEHNSAVRMVNQFVTHKPSNVAEFIQALQRNMEN